MSQQHLLLRSEMLCQLLGEIDRAVLSAGAADGDGEVAAVVCDEAGQPACDEVVDVGEHLLREGGVIQKVDHGLVASGERAQRRIVMRVGQAAHVEYEIGVQRQPVLETEGLEQQGEPGAIQRDELLDPGAQGVGVSSLVSM